MTMHSSPTPNPCPTCGLKFQCICHQRPQLNSRLNILLLTHENEYSRENNTGKLLSQTMSNVMTRTWLRGIAPDDVDKRLTSPDWQTVLVFPSEHSHPVDTFISQSNTSADKSKTLFIIIDATWQEAKKMHRRTEWLKALPHVHLTPQEDSYYSLRRNQSRGHLCTCEVVIELLKVGCDENDALQLQTYFNTYIDVYRADKCGHTFKVK